MLHFPRWKVLAILAVALAGVVLTVPNVLPKPWQDTVGDDTELRLKGSGQISGNLTAEDVNNLAIAPRSGSLPARLVYIDAANESAGGGQAKGSEL